MLFTTRFNIKKFYILTQSAFICVDLSTNRYYFATQHWFFYNREGVFTARYELII
jgi:hypothetical protein